MKWRSDAQACCPCLPPQVLDSPFSRLSDLMMELATDQTNQLRIPKPLLKARLAISLPTSHTLFVCSPGCVTKHLQTPTGGPGSCCTWLQWKLAKCTGSFLQVALAMMRRSVRKRAGFSIDDVSPLDKVSEAFIPALFGAEGKGRLFGCHVG